MMAFGSIEQCFATIAPLEGCLIRSISNPKSCHIVSYRDPGCSFRIRCNIKDFGCVGTKVDPHQCLPDVHNGWRTSSVKYLQPANQAYFDNVTDVQAKDIVGLEGAKGNIISYKQG